MGLPYAPRKFGRSLRREGGHRIPVILVTGFLGAGKTTLVKHLLAQPETANTAIIVNEFGEIGIDDALLRSSAETTVLLDRGCLCCAVRTDLQETLRDLLSDRLRGKVPDFERIIIETSGMADPGPILQTFLGDQGLGRDLYLLNVVCVVDAAILGQDRVMPPEALKQIALSDRIVVSKSDIASDEELDIATARLDAINPSAARIFAEHGRLDTAFLLDDSGAPIARNALFAEAVSHLPEVDTFSLVFDRPLHWEAFSRAIDDLRLLRAADLLRVKGLLAVKGCAGPVVVHYVQHLGHAPMELGAWPTPDTRSRLVFIVRGIAQAHVRALIETLQDLAAGRPDQQPGVETSPWS